MDKVPTSFIKYLMKYRSPYYIVSLSVQEGVFRYRLKTSISKILEKIVIIQLVNHLDINKLNYHHQYGFQHGNSSEHNLIHAENYIGNAINEGKYALGVLFDLKKAFDGCSHNTYTS
jgi:hypothetical protein